MNGQLICMGIAGTAAECRGVEVGERVKIEEIRFGHMMHLQFIIGRTIASLLAGSYVLAEDGSVVLLSGAPQLEVPCRVFDVPYCLKNAHFNLAEEKRP